MIRLLRGRPASRRTRAAERLLGRHERGLGRGAETETALDEDALREMERIWAAASAVADDPRIRAARLGDLESFQAAPPQRRSAAIAATLALALAGAGSLAWFCQGSDRQRAGAPDPRIATEIGQRKRVVLADTSSVALDTDSEVEVSMRKRARGVTLRRGRAFFRVAKDSARPFIVSAGDKRVRAVGTAFDVRIQQGRVIVTVLEGTVEVTERHPGSGAGQSARISAGTQLAALEDSSWTTHRVDPAQSATWLTGRLSFVDEPLAAAVREMNRYTRQKIILRSGLSPQARILGVFRAGDTMALAQAIELNGSARIVETTPDHIVVESADRHAARNER